MNRNLMEKLALICTSCLCALVFWLDAGAEYLLRYLLRSNLFPDATRQFQYISISVCTGILLIMVFSVLYLFREYSDDSEEDEE